MSPKRPDPTFPTAQLDLFSLEITTKSKQRFNHSLCSWPSGGTAAWPRADSGHRPSTSAGTRLENIQRADAGGAPVPESCWYRCTGLESFLDGSVWTGLIRAADADAELDKRKVRDGYVIHVKRCKSLKCCVVIYLLFFLQLHSRSHCSHLSLQTKGMSLKPKRHI